MRFTKQASLIAAAVAAIACPAFGTINVDVGVTTSGASVANALNVTTTENWIGTDILVSLTQGSVLNVETLGAGGVGGSTAVELGAPLGPPDTGPSGISVEWQGNQNSGLQTMGNFVFSDDAEGTWSLAVFESFNAQANFISGTLSNGVLQTNFLPGDVNDDLFNGIEDLNIVLGQWNTDGSADPHSDPSGDGFVGIEDLNLVLGDWNASMVQGPWDYNPIGVPGDLDGDGFTGVTDLNELLLKWHNNVTPGDQADPSGDGFVGLDDMNIVLSNFNAGTPPTILIPEPTALALLSLGTLALFRRRQA